MDYLSWFDPLWALFISAFISSTLLPGGSEALLALLTHQNSEPLALLVSVATLGNVLGAMVTFFIGVYIATKYPVKQFDKPMQQKALNWLQRYGSFALLMSWLPVIGDPLCLVAGWLRLHWLWACLAIATGKLLRYAIVAGLFSF